MRGQVLLRVLKKEQAMLQNLLSVSPEGVIEKVAARLLELQTDKKE